VLGVFEKQNRNCTSKKTNKKKKVGMNCLTRSVVYNVGVNPSFCAITSDSKYAYVTNSNNFRVPNEDSVTVLNLEEKLPSLTIHDPSFQGPYRVAIDATNSYAYVTNSESPAFAGQTGTVSVIDVKRNRVSSVIGGFDGPSGVVIAHYIYVLNFGASGGVGMYNGKTISVVDPARNTIVATIEIDRAPQGMALSPCRRYLFVVCYVDGKEGSGTMNVIDTKQNAVIAKISGFFGPFSIAVSPCGSYAFVSNFGSNDFAPFGHSVAVVNVREASRPSIVKYIHKVGIQPSGLGFSKDGKYLFVSNYNALYAHKNFQDLTYGQSTINVIRTEDFKVIPPTIPVGETAATLTLSPDGKKLLVCQFVQNTVSEIEIELERGKSTIEVLGCC
jgi:YVTN family beta-propeller protein